MKTIKTILAVVLAAACCTEMAAQGFRREPMPEGSYSPVTNINRNGYPRVLSDGSVMFRVNAPQAQLVQIDLGGTKYGGQFQQQRTVAQRRYGRRLQLGGHADFS